MPDSTAATLTAPPAAPVAAAPPAATALTAPPPAAPPAVPLTWIDGADEVTVGYAQNKGWKNPLDVVTSYKNLESVVGADRAGRTVVLPKADATPEELSAYYTKLGRPTEATGYNLPVPEGGSKEFATAAAAKFFELGIPQTAGQKLTEWINETAAGHVTQTQAQQAAARSADDVALRSEWGAAFDQNIAAARAAVTSLGVKSAEIDAMAAAIGHGATMRLFAQIGAKTLEPEFVAGKTNDFSNALTPGQAQDKIKSLQKDGEWQKRYFAGGAAERAEMTRLQSFAYPPKPA